MGKVRHVHKKVAKSVPFKSLNISDIHMSNSLAHAKPGPNGVTDRLQDQKQLWRHVFATALEYGCHAIFVQGDLFDHHNIDPITLAETVHSLSETPIDLFLIGGNHDGVNTRGERFSVEALSVLPRCHYMLTGETYEPRPWLSFWPLEFAPLDKNRESLASFDLDEDDVNVLLMHNSVQDCTHLGWTCDDGLDPEETVARFDHVLSGHFHDPQSFGERGRYLGAPMHHHFGDVGREAGFWIMEFKEDGTRTETFIDGECPKFFALDWDDMAVDEDIADDDGTFRSTEGHRCQPGDYVRIKVTATHAEVVRIKPIVEKFVAGMNASGYRAMWTHKAVYHHTTRLVSNDDIDGSGIISPGAIVKAYVDAPEVDSSGLDLKQLRKVGREIMTEVAAKWDN